MGKNRVLTWPMAMLERGSDIMVVRNVVNGQPIVWRDGITTEIPKNMDLFEFVENAKKMGWSRC